MHNSRQSRSLSRSVRRLAHRQPLPQSFPERIVYLLEHGRRVPFTLLCSLLVIASLVGFHHYLVHSDYFEVEEIAFVENERLGESVLAAYLLRATGLETGVSALQVDCPRIESELLKLPEVQSVGAEVVWPDRVQVTVRERIAAGILVSSTGSHVYDRDGFLFAEATPADFLKPGLKILTGLDGMELTKGKSIPSEAFASVEHYLSVFQLSNPAMAAAISEINWNNDTGITLVFDSGERFSCGYRPPEKTGPVIERLLQETPADMVIRAASLHSDVYAMIRREPAPVAPITTPEGGLDPTWPYNN